MKNDFLKTKSSLFVIFSILLLGPFLIKNSPRAEESISSFPALASSEKKLSIAIKIPILIYHYVGEIRDKKDTVRTGLTVAPYFFEKQMAFLAKNGFTAITPGDLAESFYFGKKLPTKPIVITFDDGYEDFYNNVFPVLKKYNFPAVNFLIGNAIESQDYLTERQIKEMLKSGLLEIGAHTLSHLNLVLAKEAVMEREIISSKRLLEEKFGIPIKYFSYPYGSFNQKIENSVKAAGYQSAVTTTKGVFYEKNSLYRLPRLRPGNFDDQRFKKLLEEGI